MWGVFFLIIGIILLYNLVAFRKQNSQMIELIEEIERKLGKIPIPEKEII